MYASGWIHPHEVYNCLAQLTVGVRSKSYDRLDTAKRARVVIIPMVIHIVRRARVVERRLTHGILSHQQVMATAACKVPQSADTVWLTSRSCIVACSPTVSIDRIKQQRRPAIMRPPPFKHWPEHVKVPKSYGLEEGWRTLVIWRHLLRPCFNKPARCV